MKTDKPCTHQFLVNMVKYTDITHTHLAIVAGVYQCQACGIRNLRLNTAGKVFTDTHESSKLE